MNNQSSADRGAARAVAAAAQRDREALQQAIKAAGQQQWEGAFKGAASSGRVIFTARIVRNSIDLQAVDVLSDLRGQTLMMACAGTVATPLARASVSWTCRVGPKSTTTRMWYDPKADEWILTRTDGSTIRFSRHSVQPWAQ
jgi:hypothetical protein